jgi:hypothetical protein
LIDDHEGRFGALRASCGQAEDEANGHGVAIGGTHPDEVTGSAFVGDAHALREVDVRLPAVAGTLLERGGYATWPRNAW